MKKIVSGVLASLCAATALAVAPYPGPVVYTQPDGTKLQVTIKGSEHAQIYYTSNGEAMLPDSTGMLRPASAERISRLKAAAVAVEPKGIGMHTGYVSTSGSPRVCVILVQFADVKFSVSNPADYFNRWLNEENFSDDAAIGSVRDYFVAQSAGKFSPRFDVYGPVTLSGNRSTYAATSNAYKMVHQAAASLDSSVDFSTYDLDSDGNVDNVFIIYAGQGSNHGASQAPWPHNSTCPTGLFTRKKVDGKLLYHYACASEQGRYTYCPDGIGTFIHEFGHVLGLPDLYNTETANDKTPNWWSVMDTGCYLGDSRTPCNYSAYERRACDWLDYTPLTNPCRVNLRPMADHNFACVIETGRDRDFYVLENRPSQGWDCGLPGQGMFIWHIDGNDTSALANTPNNNSDHLLVDLIEADNSTGTSSYDEMGGDPWPGLSNNTSFTATSTPAMVRWNSASGSGTTPVDKPVTNIARANDGLVTFDFMGGSSSNLIDPAPEVKKFTVTVSASPSNGGTVFIGSDRSATTLTEAENTSLTLHAEPASNFRFLSWQRNGSILSTSSAFTITLSEATAGSYSAIFEEQSVVTEKYCKPQGNADSGSERYISSITLSDNSGSPDVTVSPVQSGAEQALYADRTSTVFVTRPGATVTFRATGNSAWTHAYMYIDWEDDGFIYGQPSDYVDPSNGYAILPGVDLVYYSRWSPQGTDPNEGGTWYSSAVGLISGSSAHNAAATDSGQFTIPADAAPGDYRIRFKSHWCSLDPCGDQDSNTLSRNTLAAVGGAIVDFTIRISRPLTVSVAALPVEGGTVSVGNDGLTSVTLYADDSDRSVTLHATPSQQYIFKRWECNGVTFATTSDHTVPQVDSDVLYTAIFEYQYASIHGVDPDSSNASCVGRTLHLWLSENEKVTIFASTGAVVASFDGRGGHNCFELPQSGIYLVRIGCRTLKIAAR